jgi:hypothetical protein
MCLQRRVLETGQENFEVPFARNWPIKMVTKNPPSPRRELRENTKFPQVALPQLTMGSGVRESSGNGDPRATNCHRQASFLDGDCLLHVGHAHPLRIQPSFARLPYRPGGSLRSSPATQPHPLRIQPALPDYRLGARSARPQPPNRILFASNQLCPITVWGLAPLDPSHPCHTSHPSHPSHQPSRLPLPPVKLNVRVARHAVFDLLTTSGHARHDRQTTNVCGKPPKRSLDYRTRGRSLDVPHIDGGTDDVAAETHAV